MDKNILVKYKKKKIKILAKNCNFLNKFIGLMFSEKEKAKILLFKFDTKSEIAIHSFFVFYSFIAIWLDDDNNVVDLGIVKPFCAYASSKKQASSLIEIPINKKYKKFLSFFYLN